MANTLVSKNFLAGKRGEFWMKNQIILHYPQPVKSQEVFAQVKALGAERIDVGQLQVKILNKEHTAFLVMGPGIHSWGEEILFKVHNPRPLPPPPPPILPDGVSKNKLWLHLSGTKPKVLTTAETFKTR
ncbi:hypothetical protein ACTHQF_00575 [Pedobacter sp. SAFR-022]|uniref:hypothetical protein n=1 Tax=Pedobacter sp. SAFR-022 TaxID=3436861 RepID=UPI003F7DD6A7